MAFMKKWRNRGQVEEAADSVTKQQKDNLILIMEQGTPEQKSAFLDVVLGADNVKDLLKVEYLASDKDGYSIRHMPLCEGLIKTGSIDFQPIDFQLKLLRVIAAKAPDLLEKTAPMIIENIAASEAYKSTIQKIWEYIKTTDNPADPKILKFKAVEPDDWELVLAHSLFASKNGFSLVPDFLDWLKDPSVLKAYAYKHQVEFIWNTSEHEGRVWHFPGYKSLLLNYIADKGSDKERLELLNTIDRLKAYELFLEEDKAYDQNDEYKNYVYDPFYSIILTKSGEEPLLKFLDIVNKMGDNEELIKSKFTGFNVVFGSESDGNSNILATILAARMLRAEDDPESKHYKVYGFAPLVAARILHEWDRNPALAIKLQDYLMSFAEKYPSILIHGSVDVESIITVDETLARTGGEEIHKRMLKFIKIPRLEEPITILLNKYGSEEIKKEVQKFLLGPFKPRSE
jgi:hypothetical protein